LFAQTAFARQIADMRSGFTTRPYRKSSVAIS
jgi:hypothetical protein